MKLHIDFEIRLKGTQALFDITRVRNQMADVKKASNGCYMLF